MTEGYSSYVIASSNHLSMIEIKDTTSPADMNRMKREDR